MKVEGQNPKAETREPKEGRNPKSDNGGALIVLASYRRACLINGRETQPTAAAAAMWRIRPSGFGLLSALGFRLSDLGLAT